MNELEGLRKENATLKKGISQLTEESELLNKKIDFLKHELCFLIGRAALAVDSDEFGEISPSDNIGPKLVRSRNTNDDGEHEPGLPGIGICKCGNEMELWDSMDNACEVCDANYNSSMQEVVPMNMCNDNGEPYSDYED